MEQFEYHQIKDRRPRPKNESVLRSLQNSNRTSPPLSLLNKRQSHRLNANRLNCTLEFSRRKTYLLGERWKKDLLIYLFCLFTRLKHCFLAGLTLSIDHIFGSMLQPYPFTFTLLHASHRVRDFSQWIPLPLGIQIRCHRWACSCFRARSGRANRSS